MKDADSDREMRARFARLREQDRALAISFERARAGSRSELRAGGKGHRYRLVAATAATAAVAVIALLTVDGSRNERDSGRENAVVVRSSLAVGEWQAPTDFLLRTPGLELLRTMPAIGRPTGWGLSDEKMNQLTPKATSDEGRTS